MLRSTKAMPHLTSLLVTTPQPSQAVSELKQIVIEKYPLKWVFEIVPYDKLGIDQVRSLQKFLTLQASHLQCVCLLSEQAPTLPAQHALLKLLEEPGANTLICLVTPHPDQLVPTLLSRCEQLELSSQPANTNQASTTVPLPINLNPGEVITWVEQNGSKLNTITVLQGWLQQVHDQPRSTRSLQQLTQINQSLHLAKTTTVNHRLLLEHLLLSINFS